MQTSREDANGRQSAALIVAHPGHECLLHGWLEANSPRVYVLTDGSGLSGTPRINRALGYLGSVGATSGSIFGRFKDITLYEGILNQDTRLFCDLADEIADEISAQEFDYVVGDAMEGYNPVHDICRIVIDCAVEATRKKGRQVRSYDFPVVDPPHTCSQQTRNDAIFMSLDDETFQRKIDTARTHYPELVDEVERALCEEGSGRIREYLDSSGKSGSSIAAGLEMFRTECLRLVIDSDKSDWSNHPSYETRNEAHVRAGHFDRAIRYREHLYPLAAALRDHLAAH